MENKLAKIQSELKVPKENFNSFGKYNYRSCEDILEAAKPILKQLECSLILTDTMVVLGCGADAKVFGDKIAFIGQRFYCKATAKLLDSDKSVIGESDGWAREEEFKKGMDSSQITGTASSYARKYALNGLFSLDDAKDSDATNGHDDKNIESRKTEPAEQKSNSDSNSTLGLITAHVPGDPWHKFVINGKELSSKKPEIISAMISAKEKGKEVDVIYSEVVNGRWTNRYIDEILPVSQVGE